MDRPGDSPRPKTCHFDAFGFIADHNLTPKHNAIIQLKAMPTWLYFCRPSNLSFHNLCTSPSNFITPVTKSLLGLGLNFCVRPQFSTRPSDVDFIRLRRNAWTPMFFAGGDPLPKMKLVVPSKWSPSREFRVRFSEFEREAALIFRPRRFASNTSNCFGRPSQII